MSASGWRSAFFLQSTETRRANKEKEPWRRWRHPPARHYIHLWSTVSKRHSLRAIQLRYKHAHSRSREVFFTLVQDVKKIIVLHLYRVKTPTKKNLRSKSCLNCTPIQRRLSGEKVVRKLCTGCEPFFKDEPWKILQNVQDSRWPYFQDLLQRYKDTEEFTRMLHCYCF